MLNEDSIQFAIENTEIILAPQSRIETFGSTVFRFYLVSELMDTVGQVRVRDGKLHAERPLLIAPKYYDQMLEGFGERAEQFVEWMKEHGSEFAVMKYGFQFKKTDMREEVVHSPLADVVAKLREQVERDEDAGGAIIHGTDEGWEVCLLKFATDMIQRSAPGNMGEWKRRGLI